MDAATSLAHESRRPLFAGLWATWLLGMLVRDPAGFDEGIDLAQRVTDATTARLLHREVSALPVSRRRDLLSMHVNAAG